MPHPCALDETLEGCAELAAAHALETVPVDTATSIREAFVANAPVIAERLNNAMLKIGEWVEATENFAVEQTPFLVQEILRWGVAEPAFWVILGIILMSLNPISMFHLRKSHALRDFPSKVGGALAEKGNGGDFAFALIGVIIAPITGFLCIVINIMNMLKPMITPRLYLIEYFQELVG